jgi:hypothetical protein
MDIDKTIKDIPEQLPIISELLPLNNVPVQDTVMTPEDLITEIEAIEKPVSKEVDQIVAEKLLSQDAKEDPTRIVYNVQKCFGQTLKEWNESFIPQEVEIYQTIRE